MKENWSSQDLEYFKKMISIVNRGYFLDSRQLCDLYNRVFETQLRPTGCSSCNRLRYNELKSSYDKITSDLAKAEIERKEKKDEGQSRETKEDK